MNNANNAIPIFIYLLLEEDERRNHMRLERRHLRDTHNPFEIPDIYFKQMYRLNKNLVRYLINNLEPHANPLQRTSGLPLHLQVLSVLHFLANGSYQHSVGYSSWSSMSQPSVSRAISKICRLITNVMMPRWIRFPTTRNEKTSIKQSFFEKYGFRGVIGAIDGTHVDIIAPPISDLDHPPHVYINRKGKYSINVMLICDSNNTIIACDARFPGSVHDAAIWKLSNIRQYLRNEYENGDTDTHLIGDSGYGLEPWLFTPFAAVVPGSSEARFNELLKMSRNVIERTNGILKTRFRCLLQHRTLHYHPTQAAYIIYAAAVLHNIAVSAHIDVPEDDYENNEAEEVRLQENLEEQDIDNDILVLGRAARQLYIQRNLH